MVKDRTGSNLTTKSNSKPKSEKNQNEKTTKNQEKPSKSYPKAPEPKHFKFTSAYSDTNRSAKAQRIVYSCEFHPFVNDTKILATAGGPLACIYEVADKSHKHEIRIIQTYEDKNAEEDFFTCCWCLVENESCLLVAGETGNIRMINAKDASFYKNFQAHGSSVNELKRHPRYPMIIGSASKDMSIRLWNVENDACLAVFGGQTSGFADFVSLDFSPCGGALISSGMDHQLNIWELERGAVAELIGENELQKIVINEDISDVATDYVSDNGHYDLQKRMQKSLELNELGQKTQMDHKPIFIKQPIFSTNKVHKDYVDCVKFTNNYFISKSCHNTVMLWRAVVVAKDIQYPEYLVKLDGHDFKVWFMKFGVSKCNRLLAQGTVGGDIYMWKLCTEDPAKTRVSLKFPESHVLGTNSYDNNKTVRQVCFSNDGRTVVSVHDNSVICRYDAD